MVIKNVLISIDCGSTHSGVVVLIDGVVLRADNPSNEEILATISNYKHEVGLIVLIEDIAPYFLPLKQDVIDTCKWIGRLECVLNQMGIDYRLIYRWQVKKWVFDKYPEIVIPRIDKKIFDKAKKDGTENEKKPRKASFVYVDDRIVLAAMKEYWNIQKPKVGKKSEYGLSRHSWQALGVATYYLDTL